MKIVGVILKEVFHFSPVPLTYAESSLMFLTGVRIQQIKLCVKIGDITHEKCDIVVNGINDVFDFDRGTFGCLSLPLNVKGHILTIFSLYDNPSLFCF